VNLSLSPELVPHIKLWILIPSRSLNCLAPHHVTLLGTLRTHGIWYTLRTLPGDSLITRSRNNLADIFLHESTDDENHYSLWLDDDITFDPESVLQMISLNKDFVAAPYTKKGLHMDRMKAAAQLDWKSQDLPSCAGTPNVNFLVNDIKLDEPCPVLEAGSGFWLVKRKVFRMMSEELPIRYRRALEEKEHYGRDHAFDFFKVGIWPDTGEYLSEDWWFCREWRKLGGMVWMCWWIQTYHYGQYAYPMNMDAVLGLLSTTGGFIHGETWPKKGNQNVETVNGRREAGSQQKDDGTLGAAEGGEGSGETTRTGATAAD
jgi:hypothetical protein